MLCWGQPNCHQRNLMLIFYTSHQHLVSSPPLVLIAALCTSSAVMSSCLIGWIFWASSGSKIIGSRAEAWRCFISSLEMVSWFKGRVLWSMLTVRSFNGPLTFSFCISSTKFLEVLATVFHAFADFKFLWIVRLSWSNSNGLLDCQSSILHRSAFRWSFDWLSFEGFWRSKLGIIITAFITVFVRGESSIHALNSFVNLLMNNLPAFPVERRNIFFSNKQSVHRWN